MKPKNPLIRTSSVVLMICMIISLAACTGGSATPSPTPAPAETAAAATATVTPVATAPVPAAEAPTLIRFMSTQGWEVDPIPWYETENYKDLLELANVEIEYFDLDEDKYSLALASNDMGDFMYTHFTRHINTVVEGGLALDIKPLVEEYCPNMLNPYFISYVNLVSELTTGGENFYFFPQYVGVELVDGGVENLRGYFLRWDYYKEIGAPEINDDRDFADIIEQMVTNHPETPDGKKVWGLGTNKEFTNFYYHSAMTTTLTNPWTFSGFHYMQSIKNLDLVNGYLDVENSAFWHTMLFYNDLYNRGLFDIDSFTMTSDDHVAKMRAGQYVACVTYLYRQLYTELRQEDPDTLGGMISVPSKNSIVFANNPTLSGWYPSYYSFIPANSDKWEAVMRLHNLIYDPNIQRNLLSGAEGKYWNYINGVPTPTDEAIQIYSGDADKKYRIGFNGLWAPFQVMYDDAIIGDGYPASLFETADVRKLSLTPLLKDFSDFYGVDLPSQIHYKNVANASTVDWSKTYGTELLATAITEMPMDIARILTRCNDVMQAAMSDLVTAPSVSEFESIRDKCLAEISAAGEAEAWEWCLAEFNNALARMKDILGY